MRVWVMLFLPAIGACLHGAIIRGVVVENQTGKPLSRTLVTVRSIGGGSGTTLRVDTNARGGFEFTPLRAGAYIVTASRRNFASVQFGQKDFQSAGLPIILEEVSATFLDIRMPRLGAITGRVVDDNDVGMPNHDLAIYSNTRPPQMLMRVQADERGVYRFFGLDPGSYLVRTAAREYEAGSYVPTFGRDTTLLDEARVVEVNLDQEVENFDVRPKQGIIYKVEGVVLPGLSTPNGNPETVKLTRASEMGRDETNTNKNFRFNPEAPGDFELYAEGPGNGSFSCFMLGGYQPLRIKDRDLMDIQMPVPCVRETSVSFVESHGQFVNPRILQLVARRKDLAGVGESKVLPVDGNRVPLAPGRWELMLRTPPNYCVVDFSFSGPRSEGMERGRPDGWNEILVGSNAGYIRFAVSSTPGAMHGLVSGLSHEPVAGAPVYLEGYDPEQRKRVTDLQVALTDARGQYQFHSLAPGSYRVLATFEFQRPDATKMESAGPKSVKVQEGADTPQDLDLWVIR